MEDSRHGTMMRQMAASCPEPTNEMKYRIAMVANLGGRSDFKGTLLQAEYWQFENNWKGAFEMYKRIFDQLYGRKPPEKQQVYTGISRYFYEMGRCDGSIDVG